jgi:hypothetical protein
VTEPLIVWITSGGAEAQERENNVPWLTSRLSVQEICWLYAFAGSNLALPKPCITADFQPPEPICGHRVKENNLLSLYPITSHNQCAKFGFLTQLDTNQTDSGQMNLLFSPNISS